MVESRYASILEMGVLEMGEAEQIRLKDPTVER